jgi:GNAT superfamily N-acetyltransferase
VVNDQVVGLLLLMTRPSYFSNLRHAEEVAWWVSPEYRTGRLGIKLLRAAQEWCSHSGVDVLQMSAPAGSSTGEFLRRDGFTFVEEMHLIRIQRADVAVREQDAGSDQRQPEDGGG